MPILTHSQPLLATHHWHGILQMSAVVYCGGAVLTYTCFGGPGSRGGASNGGSASSDGGGAAAPKGKAGAAAEEEIVPVPMGTLIHVTLTTPRILFALGIAGFLNPLYNFTYLVPLYLEHLGYTVVEIASLMSALPLGSTLGIIWAGLFWDRMKEKAK